MSPDKTDRPGALPSEAGFSLTELLAAFAVLGLVLAGITAIQVAAQRAYLAGATKTEVDQHARIALDRLATEIRQASGPVTAATATSITFPDTAGIAVTYTLTAGALTRNGVAVIGGVRALTFAYRNAADAALPAPVGTPTDIRRVIMTIQTQGENALIAGSGSPDDSRTQLETSARLRNL
jgi:Tfp pilus assembly protein PilW